MTASAMSGFAHGRFSEAADHFAAHLESGAEVGASFCATVEGETVVDLWGGSADEARTRPWRRDTLVNVYSTTKTMTALCALILADRGDLDFDAPVARYWPEFAQNGKSEVKVSHLMAHSSGLSGWKDEMTQGDLYDWDKATALLAAQTPFWAPGTAPGYHGITQGYLIGEVVRRITGRTLGAFFRHEVAEPLQADFYIGLPASEDGRVADLIPPPVGPLEAEPSELRINLATNPPIDPLQTRTRKWRAAEIPAANGHGHARAIAQIHTVLANGGVAWERRLLSEAGCRRALEPQIAGYDPVLGVSARFGLGFGLPGEMLATPNPNVIFWSGYGGSLALIDMDARLSFGYAMNRMAAAGAMVDERPMALLKSIWKALAA